MAPAAAAVLPSDFIVATEAVAAAAAGSSNDPRPGSVELAITPFRRTSMPVANAEPEAEVAAEEHLPAANMVRLHYTADPLTAHFIAHMTRTNVTDAPPILARDFRGGNFYRAQFFKMEEIYIGHNCGSVHFTMFPIRCSETEQVYRRLVCKNCVRVFKERLEADEHGFLWPPTFYRTMHPTAKIHFFNDLYCTAAANHDANGQRIIAELPGCGQCIVDFTERVNLLFRHGDRSTAPSSLSSLGNLDQSMDENDSEA
jgi:hypothetical protein